MKSSSKIFLIFLAFSLSMASCSKDDSDDYNDQDFQIIGTEFMKKIQSMETPSGLDNSENSNAQFAKTNFEYLKFQTTPFFALFNIPPNATNKSVNVTKSQLIDKKSVQGNGKTYTWDDGMGGTVVYTIVEQKDRFLLSYSLDSPYFKGKMIDGYMKKDSSNGELKYYSEDGDVELTMDWTLIDNIYKFNYVLSNDLKMTLDYDFNSKECKMASYYKGELKSEWFWNQTGAGWVVTYDEDGNYIKTYWRTA